MNDCLQRITIGHLLLSCNNAAVEEATLEATKFNHYSHARQNKRSKDEYVET